MMLHVEFPLPSREGLGVGAIHNNNYLLLLRSPPPFIPPRKGEGLCALDSKP